MLSFFQPERYAVKDVYKLLADPVISFPQGNIAVLDVIELVGAVQGGAVKFDVVMDMFLVNVSGYNKLVFAADKFQSQLVAQLVGLLRCNGS